MSKNTESSEIVIYSNFSCIYIVIFKIVYYDKISRSFRIFKIVMLSFNLSFEITYSFDITSRMKFQNSVPPTLYLEANSSKELASSDLRLTIYSNLY
jgi:hypothetical protein